ncbi:MAG: addiction module protein [Verrucomicrobia subdivision 3 bacterium]|nr:addiction module protein [Limisphaerales bacterium]
MTKAAEIIQEAEALPPAERSLVVDSLLQTLHKPDPAIDAQWAATAQRRLVELRSGQTKAVPGDEVFAKVRARFEK